MKRQESTPALPSRTGVLAARTVAGGAREVAKDVEKTPRILGAVDRVLALFPEGYRDGVWLSG